MTVTVVKTSMKKTALLLVSFFFLQTISAQNFNPLIKGYKAIDTLHINELTYFSSVYFISDHQFVYYDLDTNSTDITRTRNFYIGIYDIKQKKTIANLPNQSFELKYVVSESGKHLIVFDENGANFYKINSGKFQFIGLSMDIDCSQSQVKVAFTKAEDKVYIPCNNTLFSIGIGDNSISREGQLTLENISIIWSVELDATDKVIALGCEDGLVQLLSISDLSPLNIIKVLNSDISDITYNSADSTFICASGEGIATVSINGPLKSTFDLEEKNIGISTLTKPYKGYLIVGSFDYPHKLINVTNIKTKEAFLNEKNYIALEHIDNLEGGLYFDYRAVGVSAEYNYIAIALPWRDIVILKQR